MEQETQNNAASTENTRTTAPDTSTQATQTTQTGQPAGNAASTSAALLNGTQPPAQAGASQSQDSNKVSDTKATGDSKAQGLQMPGKGATPEQWADFYKQIGRPETPEGYELPIPKGDSGEFAKEIAPLLHKAGITSEQAKVLGGEWNQLVASLQARQQQAQEDAQARVAAEHEVQAQALKKEWAGEYDANVEIAKRAVSQFLPGEHSDAILSALDETIGPKAVMQMLCNIGKRIGEDSAIGISGGASKTKTTADVLFDGK